MTDEEIRELVRANPGQATYEEYKLVFDVVTRRAPCNFLIFGVGRDSTLWVGANPGGRTAFLEDVADWASLARETVPGIEVHDVRYGTLRALWPIYRHFEDRLWMDELPGDVETTAWDIVLVDAPRGTRWYRPGRMKSIYTAAVLGRRRGAGEPVDGRADVFVHDCHRRVEREAADRYLGTDRLVAEAGSMRHYRMG